MTMLTREDILRGLRRIDRMAKDAGVVIDLAVYGGAALAIVFDIRVATRDVDAVVRGDPSFLRDAARSVAEEEGWPQDWLNDGVKGFTSATEEMESFPEFASSDEGEGGLRVFTPSPQYPFAMKCMAMRADGIDGSHDVSDIDALAEIAEIKSTDDALDLVESFYPSRLISMKTRFGVEEIMERVQRRRGTFVPPKG